MHEFNIQPGKNIIELNTLHVGCGKIKIHLTAQTVQVLFIYIIKNNKF